jgi:hypothetical protein
VHVCWGMASSRSPASVALRDIVEAGSGKTYHLYMHWAQQHLTLLLLSPPHVSRSGGVGWIGTYRGELSVHMQPASLSDSLKPKWIDYVMEALKGEHADRYSFHVTEGPKSAHAEASSPSKERRSQRSTGVHRTIVLKISYRGATLIRLPLQLRDRDASAGEDNISTSVRPLSPFSVYRAETLRLQERVAALTADLQTRIQSKEEQRKSGENKLNEQIDKIQRKALVLLS